MMTEPTVVSTTPSGTELLYALGVEPAAVSHACDHPPAARDRPRLNTSQVDAASSAERDKQADGDVYDVDVDLLRTLAPDLIVTQSVCGVCAVDEELVETHLSELATEPTVLPLRAGDLSGVVDCIHEVAEAVDRPDRGTDVAEDFERQVERLRTKTAAVDARPTVAVLEWLDPLHVGANWVPELVIAAGGAYPMADSGDSSVECSWRDLRRLDPDVLVVAPCSFGVEETLARAEELRSRPGWGDLTAVQNGSVYALDGRLLNRWTPRLAVAAERLARTLQPSLFDGDAPLTPVQG